ncbi:MAG: gfo/Idh/MocA family oxidoreductase, partial [Planctomycetia bacterium]|nr:gfo/Idh/MocA family oxidoreductase [Planctomycetia bacterium]
MTSKLSRRAFCATATMSAMAAGLAGGAEQKIAGFDQTSRETIQRIPWQRKSDRKIRVGLVGYGVCRFSAEFEFQNHPNVEVVAVSDLFP